MVASSVGMKVEQWADLMAESMAAYSACLMADSMVDSMAGDLVSLMVDSMADPMAANLEFLSAARYNQRRPVQILSLQNKQCSLLIP